MVHSLSLAVAALLVSSSLAARTSIVQRFGGFLLPRAVGVELDECRETNGYENDILTRFTGIFFGDFYTGGGTDILGGLAVQGNMHAPNYVVNANHGSDCSDPDSFSSYGLVVGGIVDTFNTHVHGNAFLSSGGTIEEVIELDTGCFVTDQLGTGNFDFDLVKEMTIKSNQEFANLNPTLILETDGSLTELRDEIANYEIITFHSCNGVLCSSYPTVESDPSAILFGEGNWNGIQGSEIDPDKTYVLNIPVKNGDTIEIDGNNPTLGFNPCKLIYNFYPVDDAGQYVPDGEFTLIRRTANQFGGLTLAPRGHIVDGSVGNFSGNLIGMDYTWENLSAGVEIHDYNAAGGDCDQYIGCIPAHITSEPSTISIPTTGISSSYARTRTWSSTEPITDTSETTTVTYSPLPEPTDDFLTSEYSPCPADYTETTTSVTTTTTSVDSLTETTTVIVPDVTGTTTVTEGILTLTESGTTITATVKAIRTRTFVIIRPTIKVEYSCPETETIGEECTEDHDHHYHHHDKDKNHGKDKDNEDDDDDEDEDNDDKWDKDDKDDDDDEDDKKKWHKDDDDEDDDEDDKKKWHKDDDDEDDDKDWEDKKDKNY